MLALPDSTDVRDVVKSLFEVQPFGSEPEYLVASASVDESVRGLWNLGLRRGVHPDTRPGELPVVHDLYVQFLGQREGLNRATWDHELNGVVPVPEELTGTGVLDQGSPLEGDGCVSYSRHVLATP